MMRSLIMVALAAGSAWAQSQTKAAPDPQPELSFEVASIRPSVLTPGNVKAGVHIDGTQVSAALLSLRDYIRWAYTVKDYQIVGPDWMAGDRFDIAAKMASKATEKEIAPMIANLLAERFQMKFHRETRDLPVYALVAAKGGPKLTESAPLPPADPDAAKKGVDVVASGNNSGTTVDMGNGGSFSVGNNKIEGRRFPMLAFAETISRFTDKPVVDQTGLMGMYDFSLEFTPEDFRAMMIRAAVQQGVQLPPEALKLLDSAPGDSMEAALEKVGLKLESKKAPVEVLVIDSMEKAPTAN